MRAVFRCDASNSLGIGHVMRCLAFAETLNWAGWTCTFATRKESIESVPTLASGRHEILTVVDDSNMAPIDASLVIVDHYGLDAQFESEFSSHGTSVAVFDDLADRQHSCAILLDPTPGRSADDYAARTTASCRLMLGPENAIISSTWTAQRALTCARLAAGPRVGRIIVSMGGTDPHDATTRVLAALAASGLKTHVDVILSKRAPHLRYVKKNLEANVTLHVDPPNLPELAACADMAIGAPGTSSFERAVIGLPAILIPLADNQRFVATAFAAASAAEIVSAGLLDDPNTLGSRIAAFVADDELRASMSMHAAALTDGRGRLRLLTAVGGETTAKSDRRVRLRLAETEDKDWLLGLQRQESTRRFARNPGIPTEAEHSGWFGRVLSDEERLLAIVEVDGAAAGMIRLDHALEKRPIFEISIAVDSKLQGQGIGAAALKLARRLAPGADLIAAVHPENRHSLAMFAAAGYRPEGKDRYRSRAA